MHGEFWVMSKIDTTKHNPDRNETAKDLHPALAFFLAERKVLKSLSFYIAIGIIRSQ
jgi:hypothetical protein